MHREMSDEALMLAYRDGDAAAFEVLHGRWRGRLYRYLLHQCGNAATADELYQDIWLKVVGARLRYEVAAKFSTWLFRIAHNRLMDHFRSQGRTRLESFGEHFGEEDAPALDPPAAECDRPERMLERKALVQRLLDCIEALPAAQREAFLLAEEGEMSVDEIAAAAGVKRETAKSRLRYAIDKLRRCLRGST
jgi:RNA polymerase sigma-70 factor (ECF subfamily)